VLRLLGFLAGLFQKFSRAASNCWTASSLPKRTELVASVWPSKIASRSLWNAWRHPRVVASAMAGWRRSYRIVAGRVALFPFCCDLRGSSKDPECGDKELGWLLDHFLL
jgi:hypothetical protein